MIVDKYGKEASTFLDNFLRVTIPINYNLKTQIVSKIGICTQIGNDYYRMVPIFTWLLICPDIFLKTMEKNSIKMIWWD